MHRILITLTAVLAASLAVATASASAAEVFTNPNPITIPSSGPASPSPSTINVTGQAGKVESVVVSLRGLRHEFPRDVDVLLVSPDGDASVVMSDSCGSNPVQNVTLAFDDNAAAAMPANAACDGLLYRPTDTVASADSWPGAPAGPHASSFARFRGGSPNGAWKLYVSDDAPGKSGKIDFGWNLSIETGEPDAVVPGSPATGAAYPYPLTRTVSGMSGVVSDVNVSLDGVFHERPDDLELLLVGPRGQKVMLMGDSCGTAAIRNFSWTWDDAAPAPMSRQGACPSGARYKPTVNAEVGWPAPAPPRPYEIFLSRFDYDDPNGEWRLYAYDDTPGSANGYFMERFTLDIKTRPPARVGFLEEAADVTEGQSGELRLFRSSGGQGLGPGTVELTSTSASATSGSDFRPVATTVEFERGELQKTVSVEALADSLPEGSETFTVTVGQGTVDATAGTPATATVTIRNAADAPRGAPAAANRTPQAVGDRSAPAVTGVALRPSRFGVAGPRKARRGRRGTTIGYSLSEPATVTVSFQRRGAKRRWVAAGSLRQAGRRGRNRVAFSGRVGRRTLRPGRYRLAITAVDGAGNRSTTPHKTFRIVRR